jgi:hypothetical protein
MGIYRNKIKYFLKMLKFNKNQKVIYGSDLFN